MARNKQGKAAGAPKPPRDQYVEAVAQLKRLGANNRKSDSPAITPTDPERQRRPSIPLSETDTSALWEDDNEKNEFGKADVLNLRLANAFSAHRHGTLIWVIGVVLGLLGVFYTVIAYQIGDAKSDLRDSIRELRSDVKEEFKAIRQKQDVTEAKVQELLLPKAVTRFSPK